MKTRGTVVRIAGDTAWIRVCHGEYCAGCGMHSSESEFIEVEVADPIGARAGDRVEFESDAARMIRTVFLVFWFPLFATGLLGWIGWEISVGLALSPWLGAAVLGVAGLACAIAMVRRVERRTEAGAGMRIARIIPEDELTCRPPAETGDGDEGQRVRS
jgi:sigma-E factor negative regulatory protein RseC